MDDETRRKYIKYGIFGGIGLVLLVLAIVLPLTLGGGKPKPNPPGPTPVVPVGQNPYIILVDKSHNTAWSRSGYLQYKDGTNKTSENLVTDDTKSLLLRESSVNAAKQIGVNWTASLMTGPNN